MIDSSKIRDPRDVMRALFALRDRLSTAPSVQGAIEDQLKQGARIQSSTDLARAQAKHHALAEAAIAAADLTPEEERVCRLRYEADARWTGVTKYERLVRNGDVPSATDGQGEEVLPGVARDESGQPASGFTRVRGTRARMPSFSEIGQRIGKSEHQARRILGRALEKVRARLGRELRALDRLDELDL